MLVAQPAQGVWENRTRELVDSGAEPVGEAYATLAQHYDQPARQGERALGDLRLAAVDRLPLALNPDQVSCPVHGALMEVEVMPVHRQALAGPLARTGVPS